MLRGPWKALVISVAACAALIALLFIGGGEDERAPALLLYCAAGMTEPVERIAEQYEKEYGVTVALQFGGSGTLLSNIQVAREGDLYLAADASYIELARAKGLVAETIPIARLHPVMAVAQGNPKGIHAPEDLLREDVRVALANPDAASAGRVTRVLLQDRGLWDGVQAAVTARGVFKPTVNDVANDVKLGTVDAGIIWDALVPQFAGIEAVSLDKEGKYTQEVQVAVLTGSNIPTDALRFARYLGARDRGLPVFAECGFTPVEGDAWAWTPEILYFSGGVNRVAIEQLVKEFEAREGCKVTTVYNGCGILLGQLKLGEQPDVYHTCDGSFMKGVEDRFDAPIEISRTDIVILVTKDNPHGIASLADLAAPGLRVGLAHEEQSTLGWLTARLLRQEGLYEAVTPNVVVNTPTADLLVAQLVAGGLDAAIVYEANTKSVHDKAEVLAIDRPNAVATQTYAIARNSSQRHLMQRFLDALRSQSSRDRYLAAGFELVEGRAAP